MTHYEHLMRDERLSLREAVLRGSRERLAPVLMTALTAGLALIPLVLAGDKPGNEIQSPMGEVILGGLLSSTFLNLVVVPVLFADRPRPGAARARGESVTAAGVRRLRVPAGVGFAIGSALLFGPSTPCAKVLVGETPPLLLAGLYPDIHHRHRHA